MPTKAKVVSKKKTKSSSKSSKKVSKKSKEPIATPVVDVVEDVVEEVVEEVDEETVAVKTRKRRVVSKESVQTDFDIVIESLDQEIDRQRSVGTKGGNVRVLRSLRKKLIRLKKDAHKVSNMKRRNPNRAKNNSSGFMKPVKISKDMTKFTGWDANELKSRVDVTRFICNYVKEKDLQNPEDRRQIVPDKKLRNLLKLDKASLKSEPLTYYSLQQKIQPHFIKDN